MTGPEAERIAAKALAWLAGQPDLTQVFLGATGTGLDDLRNRAGDAEYLAGVLDFLLLDDAWITACACAYGWPPERLAQARAALPGGAVPDWT